MSGEGPGGGTDAGPRDEGGRLDRAVNGVMIGLAVFTVVIPGLWYGFAERAPGAGEPGAVEATAGEELGPEALPAADLEAAEEAGEADEPEEPDEPEEDGDDDEGSGRGHGKGSQRGPD